MSLMEEFKKRAKQQPKRIVLPEGNDARVVKAAEIVSKEGYAQVFLLGNTSEIEKIAANEKIDLSKVTIIDPAKSDKREKYAMTYYELRKEKGVSKEAADKLMHDPVFFGTMMVYDKAADGLVSGADHSTADTIRPALQVIKTAPGIKLVSSSFIMILPDKTFGKDGVMVFADCAVNIDPSAEELAEIAIASAKTAQQLCNMEPKVALLSFSTKGSAKHPLVDKVQKAVEIIKEKSVNFEVDGELQADAALIPFVAKKKAPQSTVAGKANVLIFPDLQSGNISYKLTERLAKAEAIGPILQGIAKPVNDLSRGCSVSDIVNLVAITVLQAS